MRVETCESRNKRVVLACAIVVPIQAMRAVEFLAVVLVWLRIWAFSVSSLVGREHTTKRVVVRYLSHNAKFVYNGAIVTIVKPVFHNFELQF